MRWRCSTLWKNSLVYLLRSKVGFEPSRADTYPLSHSAQTVQAADEVKKIHGWTVINSNQELNQQPLGLAAAHQQGEPFRCTKAFSVSSFWEKLLILSSTWDSNPEWWNFSTTQTHYTPLDVPVRHVFICLWVLDVGIEPKPKTFQKFKVRVFLDILCTFHAWNVGLWWITRFSLLSSMCTDVRWGFQRRVFTRNRFLVGS